jgi:hypothetical protein
LAVCCEVRKLEVVFPLLLVLPLLLVAVPLAPLVEQPVAVVDDPLVLLPLLLVEVLLLPVGVQVVLAAFETTGIDVRRVSK